MNELANSRPRRRRFLTRIAIALGALTIALGAGELGYRAWLFVLKTPYERTDVADQVHTILTSFTNALPRPRPKSPELNMTDATATRVVLHPYFGYEYVDTAARTLAESEYFKSPQAEANFDVVVLGGSVAGNFVNGGIAGLQAAFAADERFANRRVRVFVQGRAAYKEPQQLHVLEYLFGIGYQPDAVVALDGFNEVAVALENTVEDVAPSYPNASTWLMLTQTTDAEPAVLEQQVLLRRLQEQTIAQARQFENWHLEWSSILGAAGLKRIEFSRKATIDARRRLVKLIHESNQGSPLNGPAYAKGDTPIIRQSVRIWYEAARSLSAMCAARNIAFLEVLQPTFYDEGSKPLTANEIEHATSVPSWKPAVKLGYPLLRSSGKELSLRDVPFFDASMLFAECHDDLYYDACHFNEKGEHMVGEAIGRALLANLDEHGRPVAKAR